MRINYVIILPDRSVQYWNPTKAPDPKVFPLDTIVYNRMNKEWWRVFYESFPDKGHSWELIEYVDVPGHAKMIGLVMP